MPCKRVQFFLLFAELAIRFVGAQLRSMIILRRLNGPLSFVNGNGQTENLCRKCDLFVYCTFKKAFISCPQLLSLKDATYDLLRFLKTGDVPFACRYR